MTRFSKDDRVRGATLLGRVMSRDGTQVHVKWDDGRDSWENSYNLTYAYDTPDPIKVGDSVTRKVPGSIGKVEALDDTGFPRLADVRWSAEGRSFVPVDELVKVKVPSWDDVEVDDRVTFEFRGEEFTTTAYLAVTQTRVMGYETGGYWLRANFTLLSIEKPTPPLPSGAVVIVLKNGDRAHRRATDGRWIPDTILRPLSDEQVQEIGWEVAS